MKIRYYHKHLLIACAISAATSLYYGQPIMMAGAIFYLGREVRDREKIGRWDWPGLLWPVIPLIGLDLYFRLGDLL